MTDTLERPVAGDPLLDQSIWALDDARPDLSSRRTVTWPQRIVMIGAVVAFVTVAVLAPTAAAIGALATANVAYFIVVTHRMMLYRRASRAGTLLQISDEEARSIPDEDLPIYTVLLPAYDEPQIVAELLLGVGAVEYPRDKLDVKLLLEADDDATVEAARAGGVEEFAELVLVPAAEPRTKPKACNYGLLLAKGEFVTIYDAEDIPDPLQLRRAVVAFRSQPDEVACLQARLAYRNDRQNLLTRWFTSEYDTWFTTMLPGLAAVNAPIPLGGTSNHLRTDVLRELHGWDPFNVTEDADLGIRLARDGYRCGVLDSITWEEANSDSINWAKQRSRWNKGYLQTALIHLRHPRRLVRELGWRGLVGFFMVVMGTPILAVMNPVSWLLTMAWWFGSPAIISSWFPAWLLYLSMVNFTVINFLTVYLCVLSARDNNKPHLIVACFVVPLYWVLMAAGATKAFIQLATAPSYWEKTTHGLDKT